MNRFRPLARRVLTISAAMALGLIGVLVVASPASAHWTEITGKANCTNGQWTIEWTLVSKYHFDSTQIKFKSVKAKHGSGPAPTTDQIPVGGSDSTTFAINTWKSLSPNKFVGTQTFTDPTATWAHIEIVSKWDDKYEDRADKPSVGNVSLSTGCEPGKPAPTASYTDKCDGSVLVTLGNSGGKADAVFTISGVPGTTVVAPGATVPPVTVPAGTGHITVSEATKGNIGDGHDFKTPDTCAPVKLSSKTDCTTLTVQLDNPQGPATAYKVVSGSQNLTGTLAVGESKTFPAFPAAAGTTAVVTIGQLAPVTIPWNAQEACTPATTTPALAQTGSNLTPVVSIGGALLAGGAGMIALLFLLRRRRTSAGA